MSISERNSTPAFSRINARSDRNETDSDGGSPGVAIRPDRARCRPQWNKRAIDELAAEGESSDRSLRP